MSARLGCLALVLVAALAAESSARPGGGQNFRPTGGAPASPVAATTEAPAPSGESGGGGAGVVLGGDETVLAIELVVAIAVVVLLGFGIAHLASRRAKPLDEEMDAAPSPAPSPAPPAVDEPDEAAAGRRAIATLRARDPDFDPAAFERRVAATVERVNAAWVAGDLGPVRRLISDGVYVRFETLLDLLRGAGLKNAMADWQVLATTIAAAEADAGWDTVHVRVLAEARDADLPVALSSDEVDRRLATRPVEPYEEVWSFLRRRGQRAADGAHALDGRCPRCGGPLDAGQSVRCGHCKAIVNSGEHDWVLAEITQSEVFRAGESTAEVPGLAALRARDPSVSRQELEDRASVVFWKWIEARATGSARRLDRFCLAPGRPTLPRGGVTAVAVGSVDLVAIESRDGLDVARVTVLFSAGDGSGCRRRERLSVSLARSATAVSRGGLSSLDCPACDGPLADSDEPKCSWCGVRLGAGEREWSLDAMSPG